MCSRQELKVSAVLGLMKILPVQSMDRFETEELFNQTVIATELRTIILTLLWNFYGLLNIYYLYLLQLLCRLNILQS